MSVPTLPPGWRVELLGLINAAEFAGPNDSGLLWTDGKRFRTHGVITLPASSLAHARNQKEARKIGAEFLQKCYAED